MLKITLTVNFRCPWASCLNAKGFSVCILQCIPRKNGEGVSSLAKVTRPREINGQELESLLMSCSSGIERVSLSELKSDTYMALVKTRECPCVMTTLPFTNVLRVEQTGDKRLKWTLLLDNGVDVKQVTQSLEKQGVNYEVERVTRLKSWSLLTAKQEQLLKAALELGYYDIPKRADLNDLAKLFEVSPRAVNEVLRRAHKKLVSIALDMGERLETLVGNE